MSLIQDVKDIASLAKKLGNTDLYRQIVELQGEIIDLQTENHVLKEQVAELRKALAFDKKLHWIEPFYFCKDDKAPFCPNCWESENVAVHLFSYTDMNNRRVFECKKCKSIYGIPLKHWPKVQEAAENI